MKSMIWKGDNNFTLDEVDIPQVAQGTCLVKIDTAGVCGTDIHITQGLFPSPKNVVLGHEFSGRVIKVHPSGNQNLLNKNISAHTVGGCGKCENCRKWTAGHCENNERRAGAFSQYILVNEDAISIIPKGLSMENASLAEPASCSLSCVEMLKPPMPKSTAVVIGNGLLGLFTIFFLRKLGIDKIISQRFTLENLPLAIEKSAKAEGIKFVIGPND